MSHIDQIGQFCDDLDALINRYRLEYDLPLASVVGCLQIKTITIIQDVADSQD